MRTFRPEKEVCPACRQRGACHIHAYYNRFIVDFINGAPVTSVLRIMRVRCSCGSTHAILPDPVIPYRSHSLFFILRVLSEYFRRKNVLRLCDKYLISVSQLYRWKKIFLIHRREWLGLLKASSSTPSSFITELLRVSPFKDFSQPFFMLTTMSFFQSHRNPAKSRRNIPPP